MSSVSSVSSEYEWFDALVAHLAARGGGAQPRAPEGVLLLRLTQPGEVGPHRGEGRGRLGRRHGESAFGQLGSGGGFQREGVPQAAPGSGQPLPNQPLRPRWPSLSGPF